MSSVAALTSSSTLSSTWSAVSSAGHTNTLVAESRESVEGTAEKDDEKDNEKDAPPYPSPTGTKCPTSPVIESISIQSPATLS